MPPLSSPPKMLFVKPATNPKAADHGGSVLVVRDPANGRTLPPEGAQVPDNSFWHRRLKDGDVVESRRPDASKTSEKKKES